MHSVHCANMDVKAASDELKSKQVEATAQIYASSIISIAMASYMYSREFVCLHIVAHH